MDLFTAMQTGMSYTENGALTNSSTLSKNLDLFSRIGASRGKDIEDLFTRAWNEDRNLATAILLWAGDVRGGAGERKQFKDLIRLVVGYSRYEVDANDLFQRIVELGRFDNLFTFVGTELEAQALEFYAERLREKNGLAAKWAPREKSAKSTFAYKLRKALGLTSRQYRKMLVELSDTVEQKMCAGEFEAINYSHVPSVAAARYQKAFLRKDETRYRSYLDALTKGEAKINAGAVYPYDVIQSVKYGVNTAADAQWKALPDYCEGSDERLIAVVDTSGSMGVQVSGSVTAMDVAISLGMYVAERMEGVFKDKFITFSERPVLQEIKGDTLTQRYKAMSRADWSMSTNLKSVFELILNAAVKHNVPQEQMPTKVLIVSDMEFNHAVDSRGRSDTLFKVIDQMYADAGYTRPALVFWNVNSRGSNYPVQQGDTNTALVSGFSPAIMRSVLSAKTVTPEQVMLDTVWKERYFPTFLK